MIALNYGSIKLIDFIYPWNKDKFAVERSYVHNGCTSIPIKKF